MSFERDERCRAEDDTFSIEDRRQLQKDAQKEGFIQGLFWGVLLGLIGIPTACSLLPAHVKSELEKGMQSDGSSDY
jgi:hypothetical protein